MINETTWRIKPTNTPNIIRHCSKCNRKMAYYCSEKFRANANQSRVDIWLIYKCTKCDSTLKLTIYKGIRPHDLPTGLFDKFVDNDAVLAWDYGFDRSFLGQHGCTVDYANVGYVVECDNKHSNRCSCEQGNRYNCDFPLLVHVDSQHSFDLKLSALLAKMINTSIGQIKRHVEMGQISVDSEINIMKYRIKADQRVSISISSLISASCDTTLSSILERVIDI